MPWTLIPSPNQFAHACKCVHMRTHAHAHTGTFKVYLLGFCFTYYLPYNIHTWKKVSFMFDESFLPTLGKSMKN